MSLVDERLLELLPEGVVKMRDANYPITYLSEDAGEIVCDMEIGSNWNTSYDWTIYVGESNYLIIRFEAISGSDPMLRDRLIEKGADMDKVNYIEGRVRDNFENLMIKVKDITGNTLSFSHKQTRDIYEFFDITIDRNVTDEQLIDLAMAVDSCVKHTSREINI